MGLDRISQLNSVFFQFRWRSGRTKKVETTLDYPNEEVNWDVQYGKKTGRDCEEVEEETTNESSRTGRNSLSGRRLHSSCSATTNELETVKTFFDNVPPLHLWLLRTLPLLIVGEDCRPCNHSTILFCSFHPIPRPIDSIKIFPLPCLIHHRFYPDQDPEQLRSLTGSVNGVSHRHCSFPRLLNGEPQISSGRTLPCGWLCNATTVY